MKSNFISIIVRMSLRKWCVVLSICEPLDMMRMLTLRLLLQALPMVPKFHWCSDKNNLNHV